MEDLCYSTNTIAAVLKCLGPCSPVWHVGNEPHTLHIWAWLCDVTLNLSVYLTCQQTLTLLSRVLWSTRLIVTLVTCALIVQLYVVILKSTASLTPSSQHYILCFHCILTVGPMICWTKVCSLVCRRCS